MKQLYAADGSKLEIPVNYDSTWDETIRLDNKVHGYVGFDIKSGLVKVVTGDRKPIRTMRVGKFLKRSNKEECTHNPISKLASDLHKANKTELKFTTTSEDVLRVYTNGPKSCMQNCDAVAVYATEDVAVAYLEIDDDIIARAVVTIVEGHYKYARVYGEVALMEHKMSEAGWLKDDYALNGMRVLHLRDDNGELMMPFVDGGAVYIDEPNDNDTYVVLATGGDICCEDTGGRPTVQLCDSCDGRIDEDESHYSEHVQLTMCTDCFEDNHVCINGDWYHKAQDEITETEDDGYMLTDETCYVEDRDEHHPSDACVYNTYLDVYHLRSDLEL